MTAKVHAAWRAKADKLRLKRAQASIRVMPSYFEGVERDAILAQADVSDGGWYDGKTWLTGEEIVAAEHRWANRSYATSVDDKDRTHQCGGCKFFAALGSDYGLCWNKRSPHDGAVCFEHGGCTVHSDLAGEQQE